MNNVIALPIAADPAGKLDTVFPLADEGIVRDIDPRDRDMWDADLIEPVDDETGEFVALPIRVGLRYTGPAIEIGKYGLTLDDAKALARILDRFIGNFREVAL